MKIFERTNSIVFIFSILLSLSVWGARNGTPISGYPGVVLISGGGLSGTGVLISEDLILTVNHVIGKATPAKLKVFFDYVPGYQNKIHAVEDYRIYSQDIYQEIALIKLKDRAPAQHFPLYSGTLRPKTTLYGVGYGMTLNPNIRKNTMNKAEMIFKGYSPMGELLPGPDNQLGCPGDSGGPIFMMEPGQEPRVVGLSGHILGDFEEVDSNEKACTVASLARFIPIKDHIKWIHLAARGMGSPLED